MGEREKAREREEASSLHGFSSVPGYLPQLLLASHFERCSPPCQLKSQEKIRDSIVSYTRHNAMTQSLSHSLRFNMCLTKVSLQHYFQQFEDRVSFFERV